MRTLLNGGVLMKDRPFEAVAFVDNHDFRGGDEIIKDSIYNPQAVTTKADGWCEVEAPQRGYVAYGV